MKQPDKSAPAQQFTLRNSDGKDLRFEGWRLAEVSNYNPDAIDPQTRFRSGSKRWRERAVYLTKGGSIVCHKLGRSDVPGEVDRGQVLVIKRPTPGETLRERGEAATRPLSFVELIAAPLGNTWADAEVLEFFRGDSLAKDLLEALEIEDFEQIE